MRGDLQASSTIVQTQSTFDTAVNKKAILAVNYLRLVRHQNPIMIFEIVRQVDTTVFNLNQASRHSNRCLQKSGKHTSKV